MFHAVIFIHIHLLPNCVKLVNKSDNLLSSCFPAFGGLIIGIHL